tara:strand:- start:235 stop:339 length:105 start_codon:yes stop_codon:yes gene_type:complete
MVKASWAKHLSFGYLFGGIKPQSKQPKGEIFGFS